VGSRRGSCSRSGTGRRRRDGVRLKPPCPTRRPRCAAAASSGATERQWRIPGADPARESAGGVGTASMGSDAADDSRFGSLVCELDTTILLEQVDAASAGSAPESPLDSSIQRLWMWVPAGVEACIRDSVWRDVQASVKTLWASMRPAIAPAALFDGRTLRSSQQSTVRRGPQRGTRALGACACSRLCRASSTRRDVPHSRARPMANRLWRRGRGPRRARGVRGRQARMAHWQIWAGRGMAATAGI